MQREVTYDTWRVPVTTDNNHANLVLNRFKPRWYQKKLIRAIFKEGKKRAICVWTRRAGKDYCAWQIAIWQCLARKCQVFYIWPTQAQARAGLWSAITIDGTSFLDLIPPELVHKRNEARMEIYFKNGSILALKGSNNFDSLRGTNPYMVIFSEYAYQDPKAWTLFLQPVLRANDGIALFISTPFGKNEFYTLFEISKNSDEWYSDLLTIEDTEHISVQDVKRDVAMGLISESHMMQEYYCFPPHQEVLSRNALIPIADVKVNDLVISHKGRPRRVTRVMERPYIGNLIEICSYGSPEPISCTPEHPLRVYNKSTQSYEWKQAQYISSTDMLVFPKLKFSSMPVISYELCMLIAWYICDGSSSKNALQFTVNHKKKVRLFYLLSSLGIEYTVITSEDGSCVTLHIYSCFLVDFMKTHCGSTAQDKKIPFSLISSYEESFFQELMKGDGCFSVHKEREKYMYTTISKLLAYQVQLLAHSLNKKYTAGITIRKPTDVTFPHGKTYHCKQSYVVSIYINKTGKFLIPAKHSIAACVKSIKTTQYNGPVYNLQVQYDETYVVGGRSVHNCSFEEAEGSIYAKYINRMRLDERLTIVPHEVTQPVYCAMDLGWNDKTCIIFFQVIGRVIHIINYYENDHKPLEHYAQVIFQNDYTLGTVFLPHDGKQHEQIAGITRERKLKDLGLNIKVLARSDRIIDRIEEARCVFPRLWINEGNTHKLVKALEAYRREWDDKLKRYKDKPLHDWSCFTADTEVLTLHGKRRIIDVTNHDYVLTRKGWRPCRGAKKTGINAPLVEITFEDDTKVRCTPEHRFLTENGWRSAEKLTNCTKIQSSLMNSRSTLKEKCIEFIQPNDILPEGEIVCTDMYGKMHLERFLKDIISIIKMKILTIITYGTWNVYQLKSISVREVVSIRDSVRKHEMRQLNGISLLKENYGINDMLNVFKDGLNGNVSHESAKAAIKNFKLLYEKMEVNRDVAQKNAITYIKVKSVEKLTQTSDVYCISVIGDHSEFSLANGALVHNSDAADCLSYMAMALKHIRKGMTAEDADKLRVQALSQPGGGYLTDRYPTSNY